MGIIVLAAGGHARVVVEALLRAGLTPKGLTDADPSLVGTSVLGVPVLGPDTVVLDFRPGDVVLANGFGGRARLGDAGLAVRRRLFETFTGHGYGFRTVVHPAAVVAAGCALDDGAQIMAGAVIQTGTHVGVNAIVNTAAAVDHDCRISAHAHVAPGAVLCGGVTVGAGAFVGAGATVVPGVRIGDGAVIAAGAVVVRDVAAKATVLVPAMEEKSP